MYGKQANILREHSNTFITISLLNNKKSNNDAKQIVSTIFIHFISALVHVCARVCARALDHEKRWAACVERL